MKNNIFEGAYFGKPYKTRDGRKAIYNYHSSGGYHDIIIDGEGMSYHFTDYTNGILRLPHPSEIKPDIDYSCPIDIVSEWTEEVNDEELDKLAANYSQEDALCQGVKEGYSCPGLIKAYKAGYRLKQKEYGKSSTFN